MADQRSLWDAPPPEPEPQVVASPPENIVVAPELKGLDRPWRSPSNDEVNRIADAILKRMAWAKRRQEEKEALKYKRRKFKHGVEPNVETEIPEEPDHTDHT